MSFQTETGKIYSDPVIFGPLPCKFQNAEGKRYQGVQAHVHQYNIAYEVESAKLETILPKGMKLIAPHLIVRFETLEKVSWLAMRGMKRIELLVPVEMDGKKGLFNMVTWEDNGDSIIFGRDIQGRAKVFAYIDEEGKKEKHFRAKSWNFEFLTVDFECGGKVSAQFPEHLKNNAGTFFYRYLPHTGEGFVKSDANYILFAEAVEHPDYYDCHNIKINWNRAEFEDAPTQYYFLQKISDLKPVSIVGAFCAEFDRTDDCYNQSIVE